MTDSWIEDRTRYNEDTVFKVQRALHNAGLSNNQKRDCISEMLNEGILFRERLDDPAERSGWDDADVADFLARDRAQRAAATHEFEGDPGMGLDFPCVHPAEPGYCGMTRAHPIHRVTPEPAEPRRGCGPWTETSPGVSHCEKCGDINLALEDD